MFECTSLSRSHSLQSVPNTPTSKYVKLRWCKFPKVSKGACLKALASFTDFNGRCCVHTLVFSNRSISRDRWNTLSKSHTRYVCATLTSVFCHGGVQLPKKPFPCLRWICIQGWVSLEKIAAFCGPLASTSNHLQHPKMFWVCNCGSDPLHSGRTQNAMVWFHMNFIKIPFFTELRALAICPTWTRGRLNTFGHEDF